MYLISTWISQEIFEPLSLCTPRKTSLWQWFIPSWSQEICCYNVLLPMCLPYKCSVNDMLAIDPNTGVEYTINNTDQELEYNVNNIRNETCRTTLFRSCSRAMTEPISVKLHRCRYHHRPGRKGWEYMSMCWLLSESGGLTCCRCASIMSPSSIPSWIIVVSYENTIESLTVFRNIPRRGYRHRSICFPRTRTWASLHAVVGIRVAHANVVIPGSFPNRFYCHK